MLLQQFIEHLDIMDTFSLSENVDVTLYPILQSPVGDRCEENEKR